MPTTPPSCRERWLEEAALRPDVMRLARGPLAFRERGAQRCALSRISGQLDQGEQLGFAKMTEMVWASSGVRRPEPTFLSSRSARRGRNPLASSAAECGTTAVLRGREGMKLGGRHVAVLRGGRQRTQNCTRCSGGRGF